MSIHFRSLLTKDRIIFYIFPRKREMTELMILFDCDADQSRWQPFFKAKFEERGITTNTELKRLLSAVFPSKEIKQFLEEVMALDDFIRETELAGLEFYTNQMVSLNLISTLFDNTVPSIAFDWIKSDNMESSQHWLDVVEKLKPQKIYISLIDLCKASFDFLSKLATMTADVAVMNITVKPGSDIVLTALKSFNVGEDWDENMEIIDNATKCIIRVLAREILSRKCNTLFLGLPFDDTERLIEMFHHLNKKISFGTWAELSANTHIDTHTQIGDYKVSVTRPNFERKRVIIHTDLDNPF